MPAADPVTQGQPLPPRHPEVTLGPVCRDGWHRKNLVGLPGGDRVLTLGDMEFGVLRALDGRRTLHEVCAQATASSTSRPLTPDRLGRLLAVFAQRGLLDLSALPAPSAARSAAGAAGPPLTAPSGTGPGPGVGGPAPAASAAPARPRAVPLAPLLRSQWELSDVERRLRPGLPIARVIFARWAAVLLVPVVLLALAQVTGNAAYLLSQSRTAFTSWASGISVVLVLTISLAVHEWGHAIACLHWRGRVRAIGVRWRLPFLSAYAEVPGYRLLPTLGQRLGTCFAGVWTSLLLLVPAAAVWRWVDLPPTLETVVAATQVGLVASSIVNLVPLFGSDGYQLLSQVLGVRNLGQHSTRTLLLTATRQGRAEIRAAAVPTWLKGAYLVYGLASLLAVVVTCVLIVSLAAWFTEQRLGTTVAWGVGALLVMVMVVGMSTAGRRFLVTASRGG